MSSMSNQPGFSRRAASSVARGQVTIVLIVHILTSSIHWVVGFKFKQVTNETNEIKFLSTSLMLSDNKEVG